MGRADYRGGRAPIRTASELAVLLPIPILMIVEGYAQPLFPGTDRSNPSPFVAVVETRPKKTYPTVVGLPLYIHWTQWRDIVVPLLEQITTSQWRGQNWHFGDLVTLLNNIVGPNGEVFFPVGYEVGFTGFTLDSLGALYACDQGDRARVTGRLAEYLQAMSGSVYRDASAAGF